MQQTQTVVAPKSKRNTKRCVTCFQTKPLDEEHFFRASEKHDGYQNSCKACRKTASSRRYAHPGTNSTFGLPALIYERTCNRCDEPYRGPGRLLCPTCFKVASTTDSLAAEMTDGHYRAKRSS